MPDINVITVLKKLVVVTEKRNSLQYQRKKNSDYTDLKVAEL